MAMLFCKPPVSVSIDGSDYEINTDFRVWLEIERLLCSSEMSEGERIAQCFVLAYPQLPPNPFGALEEMMGFYFAGKKPSPSASSFGASGVMPVYDFAADSAYIYGSFFSQYGIDLFDAELHWWKFRALLACLSDKSKFAQVVSYRSTDTQAIGDPNKKRFYERMKKIYALPDNRTEEEKEAAQNESMECLF